VATGVDEAIGQVVAGGSAPGRQAPRPREKVDEERWSDARRHIENVAMTAGRAMAVREVVDDELSR
jgi:hypothetical protein